MNDIIGVSKFTGSSAIAEELHDVRHAVFVRLLCVTRYGS